MTKTNKSYSSLYINIFSSFNRSYTLFWSGWLSYTTGSQWLNGSMADGDQWWLVSQGSVMELVLFNIFISDNGSGIKCVDVTKLYHQAEQWAQVNFMRFSEFKHKVMDMGCGNIHLIQAGCWRDGAEPWQKGLGCSGAWEADHEPEVCSCSPKSQLWPGIHWK